MSFQKIAIIRWYVRADKIGFQSDSFQRHFIFAVLVFWAVRLTEILFLHMVQQSRLRRCQLVSILRKLNMMPFQ